MLGVRYFGISRLHLGSPRWRRLFVRFSIAFLICSDCHFLCDKFAPTILPTVDRLFVQWRVEHFAERSDRVVFAARPPPNSELSPIVGYRLDADGVGSRPVLGYSAAAGKIEIEFNDAEGRSDALHNSKIMPTVPGVFGVPVSDSTALNEFTIFAHGLNTPSGIPRLLFLSIGWSADAGDVLQLNARLRTPGTWSTTSDPISSSLFCVCSRKPSPDLRLYAPQPDAYDATRFTIAYELPEGSGVIEGQVVDADSVAWKIASGPAIEEWRR